ncbi:hypothetical protein [Microbacterium esteraromaticum]|uniref:hypothetical protein n=1 Tax=Microbacterium esteraromaticum TaxID=57043 RepID=UPI0015C64225|nr:hypothetical protein [Microbacterium esteraromaticum]
MSQHDHTPDDQGGDPACWLSQVCPECGALLDDLAAPCWRCGLKPDQQADSR